MKLWLDDMRPAPVGWYWVKTAQEAIGALKVLKWEAVSLDHDLADIHYELYADEFLTNEQIAKLAKESTGMTVINWMEENNIWPPVVIIHSWNIDAAAKMFFVANEHTKAFLRPFTEG